MYFPKTIKIGVAITFTFIICTCIDPYQPTITGYDSNLVVNGHITDANTSYTIKLSRTFRTYNSESPAVSDATVFISDDSGNKYYLKQTADGIYKTDSLEFTGVIGRSYILNIITIEGKEYKSDTCLMQSTADINKIYFEKDLKYSDNNTQSHEGIIIYEELKEEDADKHYRWEFNETWEFKIPYPPEYRFITARNIIPYDSTPKIVCWKNSTSNEIITGSSNSSRIVKQPITFIGSDQTDRLTINYSILIKKYSISDSEYNFLNNLQKVNDAGGTIFSPEPYFVESNIHSVNDPNEKILGYFEVSSVKQKRVFISSDDILNLQLPRYQTPCLTRVVDISFDRRGFDIIYGIFCITSDWVFINPIYESGALYALVFVRPECADCELTGNLNQPDFWVNKK